MAEQNSTPNTGAVNNSPTPPVQPTVPPTQPAQPVQPAQPNQAQTVIVQKSSPWPWIVGGCLTLIVIIMISVFLVGWWGIKKVKNEVKNYEPTAESLKSNLEKMNKDAEEWEKKSKELQENLPDPNALENLN
jgi:hypothetical protein